MTDSTQPMQTYADRRQRLGASAAAAGVDGVLVTGSANITYLTGFTGSAGAALVRTNGEGVLSCDSRYTEQAVEQVGPVEILTTRDYYGTLLTRAASVGARAIGFEPHLMTVEAYETLTGSGSTPLLIALDRPVERLRAVKDDHEIGLQRRAAALSEQALGELLTTPVLGRTERELAHELAQRMREVGADGPAFDMTVASGPASAVPHHAPSDRPIQGGELLIIDFGAEIAGYCADLTRTFFVRGPEPEHREPAPWQLELHALVLAAADAVDEALTPGALSKEVWAVANGVFAEAGKDQLFLHGLGHGIGLEVHERPILGVGPTLPIEPDMVLAIEPGLYRPGLGGVRIEDMVRVVGGGGHNERLTKRSRDLVVLD